MIEELRVSGCYHLSHKKTFDNRGSFSRVACCNDLADVGIKFDMIQSSIASNDRKGTIRGIHYQSYPNGESKIVSCISGSALMVVVDVREDSPTYMMSDSVVLGRVKDCVESIYVPKYCANGYPTIEDDTNILYMMDEVYSAGCSVGINYLDKKIGIQWLPLEVIISERDKGLEYLWKE
jgi:dTDP-4-dehydrorhamnose 3,5-epimerase